jgi:protein-L-isoaspartate O-methyltransferase
MPADDFAVLRQDMLAEIAAATLHTSDLIGKAALDDRVMAAMGKVPRHEFVPVELQPYAYANVPLPIGFNKSWGNRRSNGCAGRAAPMSSSGSPTAITAGTSTRRSTR